jgi:O-antigen/teichoic acid export membrane protein
VKKTEIEAPQSVRSDQNNNVLVAARGAGITFLGKIIQLFLGVGFIFVVARLMGAEQFGLYRLGVTVVMVLSAASMLGLDAGIKRYVAIARQESNVEHLAGIIRFGVGLPFLVAMGLAIVVALGAEIIATEVFNSPEFTPVLRISSIAIPLFALANSFSALAMAFKRVEYDVYTQDIGKEAAKAILSVIAILIGLGVSGVMMALNVAAILSLIPLIYLVHGLFPLRTAFFGRTSYDTREITRFSLPLFLSTLLSQFGRRLEELFLGIFSIVLNVGIYSAMQSFTQIGTFANVAVRGIATPIITELHHQKKIAELKRFYQTLTKWSLTFNLPIFLTVLIFGESLLGLLGEEFTIGAFGLAILSFGNLVDAGTGSSGVMVSFAGFSRLTLLNSVVYLGSSLVLNLLLIPRWGLDGAAWAGSLTIIIVNLLRSIQIYHLLERTLPFNRSFVKPFIAFAVTGILVYIGQLFILQDSPFWQMVVLLPVMLSIYVGVILLLGLSPEDRLVLEKLKSSKWMGGKRAKRNSRSGEKPQ